MMAGVCFCFPPPASHWRLTHNAAMRAFLLAVLLAAFLPFSHAQQDAEGSRRAIASVEQALKQRPNDPALWFFLARFHADLGDARAATAALEKVAEHGDGFLPAPTTGFAKVWDDAEFRKVVARLEAKMPRLDYAPIEFELPDAGLVPEGLAYDTATRNFYVGSIAQRKILRIDAAHTVTEFAGAGADLDQVLGLAIDSPRRRLYAVSTSVLTNEGEKRRRNAVIAFDLENGRVLRRYDFPDAFQLNDVTVAFGGRVFVSDSVSGAIFEVRAEGAPRVVVARHLIPGTNGLAASADASRLYVAHSTGLALVDPATGNWKRVRNATRENIAAIDGLYEYQGELIGVQNVTNPGRVIRITLSKSGDEVTAVRTLLSHHHNALYEPTTGAAWLEKGYFYLLAATGVSHFNREGKLERPGAVPAPKVLRVLLPR
jgi:tetratricopeptide (TPR) repeat protein